MDHQLRLGTHKVDASGVHHQQECVARAAVERRLTGQNQGARHGRGATDQQCSSCVAFVRISLANQLAGESDCVEDMHNIGADTNAHGGL